MKKFAILAGNYVQNVIVADTLEIAQAVSTPDALVIECGDTAGIGWTWDGEKFIPPLVEEDPSV